MQLYNINVATKPLKSKDLSEASICEAILKMKSTYEEKKRNAESISATFSCLEVAEQSANV